MTRTKQRQTITLEIDLIAYGDGDPEADEIRVISGGKTKSYSVRDLNDAFWQPGTGSAIERAAIRAADPKEWELAE